MAGGTFQSVTDGTFQSDTGGTLIPLLSRRYGNIPDTWVLATLGDISNYGKCDNVLVEDITNDAWVLELEDIEKDTGKLNARLTKKERTINGTRYRFQKGNVLYSKLRTYLNKVFVARENGFCTTEIIPIKCSDIVVPEYLNIVLRSPYFLDFTNTIGYGVKMPILGTNEARKAIIPVPPMEEQRRIVLKVKELISSIDAISLQLQLQ